MSWENQQVSAVAESYQLARYESRDLSAPPGTQPYAFGIGSSVPLSTEPPMIMQRMDDVNAVLRMLNDPLTSAVMLTGTPGAGKSTLAALLYRYIELTRRPRFRHLVWLRLNTYTTLPDMIIAILQAIGASEPGLFMLKAEQQISTLLRALRRMRESSLVVLDQFELLLHPETSQGVAGRGALILFLDMLKTELGSSRFVLTSYHNPFEKEPDEIQARVRSYLLSRISMPEGATLLQQRGVQGAPEDLSLAWQRCTGHVYALLQLSAVINLSRVPLNYLLHASDYQPMWSGEVNTHLCTAIYHFLSPMQRAIVRALSLYLEAVPLEGIRTTMNSSSTVDLHDVEREMEYLQHLSVVQSTTDRNGQRCFQLHSLMCMYAHEHYLDGMDLPSVSSPPDVDPLQSVRAGGHLHVANYYLQVARTQCPPIGQRTELQEVQPIISAVRHLCLARCWQRACDLLFAEKLHQSLLQWGAWNALVGLYTALLPPLGTLERSDEGLVLGQVGMLYGRLGENQQSQRYFEQALAIQRQIGDAKGEITTLINQGELFRMRSDDVHAQQNFEKALTLSEGSQDLAQRCVLLHNLGLLYHEKKLYDDAFRYYVESLQLARQLRNEQHLGMALTNLGMLFFERGMHKEALAVLLAAQQLREMRRDPAVSMLDHFLSALEQRMGEEVYVRMRQEALNAQKQVISRFFA